MLKYVLPVMLGLSASAAAAQDEPIILLTNDDGYESKDLRVLAQALHEDFIVFIAAPRSNQSGTSTAISGLRGPLDWSQFEFDGAAQSYWLDGTPSLSVHWGVDMVARSYGREPDLVISGINSGSNDAQSHHYSGTVGAARTARLRGLSALAVSLGRGDERDLEGAAEWIAAFTAQVLDHDEPVYLNINLPAVDLDAGSQARIVPHADRMLDIYDRNAMPLTVEVGLREGTSRFTYRMPGDAAADSDQGVLAEGLIAITPLRLESFDAEAADRLSDLLED